MNRLDWKDYTNAELDQAKQARLTGNEGRARVCARRAAGHVIDEYLHQRGIHIPGKSAYTRIQYLAGQPGFSHQIYEILEHLTIRVTPEHKLPIEADLISEVRILAINLIGEEL